MAKEKNDAQTTERRINEQPRFHQRAREIEVYGTVSHACRLNSKNACAWR
jgi:hypothetical protein